MKTNRRYTAALALALALAACGDSTGPQEPEDVTFATSLGIDLTQMTRLPSGVYVRTITAGTGTAAITANSNWAMNYRFWLSNGALIQQGALNSSQCSPSCIEGFEIGILGLKVGEVRQIVIPSRIGYADRKGKYQHQTGVTLPRL